MDTPQRYHGGTIDPTKDTSWTHHGYTMEASSAHHGVNTDPLWGSMEASWVHHGITTDSPPTHHGPTTDTS